MATQAVIVADVLVAADIDQLEGEGGGVLSCECHMIVLWVAYDCHVSIT